MLDFTSIFSQLVGPFFILFIFVIVISFIKSAKFKGVIGEFLVNTNSKLRLDSSIYKRLSNVTLCLEDGSTTQIDHIVLSRFGIFVIETKNMQGWIFGSEHQKRWTQSIYGKKNSFQNPLLQNYRHIKALEEILGIDRGLYSIVTFVGENEFKTDMPNNVFNGGGYIGYIESFKEEIFSESELTKMLDVLESKSLVRGRATDKKHIDSLKSTSFSSKNTYKQDQKIICSRCSSVMVERVNKRSGEHFFGCSSYPRCRHTEKL